jgi:diguanylate cyclase (GGDEF)-like protein
MPGPVGGRRVGLRLPGFRSYVAIVAVAGLVVAGLALYRLPWHLLASAGPAFWTVTALLVLAELRPLVTAGSSDNSGLTLSTAFVFAVLLHWGLPLAIAVQILATVLADLLRREAAWRSLFNVGQYALSWAAAALMLAGTGTLAGLGRPLPYSSVDLPGTLLAAVAYFLCNDAAVAAALCLHDRSPWRDYYRRGLGYRVFTESALLALAPIVVVVMERGAALLPLLILPIAAVYATASVSVQRDRAANHDPLTGLPNRKLLGRRAAAALEAAGRAGGQAALMLLDLDRFKEVNDTLGHATGDALLRLVGNRLTGALRPGDTVARLGGDEFAVLLPAVRGEAAAREVADRVHRALTGPFHHHGATFEVDGSLGIALYPEHAVNVAGLLQRADVAMYLAKETGSGIEVYSPARDRHSASRLSLFGDLRRALGAGDLSLHYQPEVALDTGAVTGVEALLRWAHPQLGLLGPEEFLALARTSGLMREITRFVLDTALGQVATWWATGLHTPVAVNVSARDLYDAGFVGDVVAALNRHGLPGVALTVEITESLLMADPGRVADTLGELAAVGVGVSLDDFGTGYSSLVHLRRLPVTELKVDRSFVARMDVSEDDAVIVRSMIELGRALGLRVVAEGVDSAAIWARLTEYACPAAQGYFLSRALPAAEITDRLRVHSTGVLRLADTPPQVPAARTGTARPGGAGVEAGPL